MTDDGSPERPVTTRAAPAWRAARRPLAAGTLVLLAGVVVSTSVAPLRTTLLRRAGHLLVSSADAPHADLIVVFVGGGTAAALEVADLVHDGVAPRVAVIGDPPDPLALEFARRGVAYDDTDAAMVKALRALGVSTPIERIDGNAAGTEDVGALLPAWCAERGVRTVVVVTTTDHSKRTSRVLRRSARRGTAAFTVVSARHSVFDPESWWRSRTGARVAIVEFEKLLLDVVRHPLS